MAKSDNIRRFLALGRWVVLATHVWLCLLLMEIVALGAYLIVSGKVGLQLGEPWDSILFYTILIPHIAFILCWGAFCLFLAVLLRRKLGAGSIRQIVVLVAVVVPLWGVRYYDRLTKRLLETPTEESG